MSAANSASGSSNRKVSVVGFISLGGLSIIFHIFISLIRVHEVADR
jgi:hypothetical protein